MVFLSNVYWLMQRQFFLIKNSLGDLFINYAIIWPCIFSFSSGYFVPLVFFPQDPINKGTELMVGMVLLQAFVVAYFMMVDLISERESSGILHYHITATSFGAAFAARVLFYVMYVFCALLPFLPVSKLLLGEHLYTDLISWPLLVVVLFFVVTLVVTYVFALAALVREMRSIEYVWSYGVEPFLWLSGMWAPTYAIAKSGVPGITYFLMINPFGYASDVLRQLFFNDPRFSSVGISVLIMFLATVFFVAVAYRLLRKQIHAV